MARTRRYVLASVALSALGAVHAAGGQASLLEFELKSLHEPVVHSLSRYQGKPVLMLFFQPDCNWCLRQVRAINELNEQCEGGFEAVAVGVRGSRGELRKELRRIRPDFPAYQASPRLLEALGGVETTPLMLVGDDEGDLVTWLRGFIATDRLHVVLDEAGLADCASR